MHWEVQVVGDTADLAMFAARFSDETLTIVKHNNEYVLKAKAFAGLDSCRAVAERAKELLTILSGSARLTLGSHTSLSLGGAVYQVKEDGGRNTFVITKTAKHRIRTFPATITGTKKCGTKKIHHPAEPIANWFPQAIKDEAMTKALRLRNSDNLAWVDLYRIYEVVEDDIGKSTIVEKGWSTKEALRQFKHTANSVAAVADQARHGKERTQPPKKAITLSEARGLIDTILKGWLEYKVKPDNT